jgi:hypothetical protein
MSTVKRQIKAIVARLAERADAVLETAFCGNMIGTSGNQHKIILLKLQGFCMRLVFIILAQSAFFFK